MSDVDICYSNVFNNKIHASSSMNQVLLKYRDYFICPNCKTGISYFQKKDLSGFYCTQCNVVFPIKDEVPIILANEIRNYNLEHPLLERMLEEIHEKPLNDYIANTLNLVESKKELSTWEWNDEEFWSKHYQNQLTNHEENNRNDRIWQRTPIVEKLLESSTLEGKVILSHGSGDGNNFRSLFLDHSDENSLYIAQDISFNGLMLNRKLNPHENSIYLLCSSDYEIPFTDDFIDVIVYFGILHHTRRKSKNISKDKRLLKKEGYILMHEALDRPGSFLSKIFEEEKSEHEEYVSGKEILSQLDESEGFRIHYMREDTTPFYTFFMLFFRNTMINSQKIFNLILSIDVLVAKTIGLLIPYMGAGSITLLAQKTS